MLLHKLRFFISASRSSWPTKCLTCLSPTRAPPGVRAPVPRGAQLRPLRTDLAVPSCPRPWAFRPQAVATAP